MEKSRKKKEQSKSEDDSEKKSDPLKDTANRYRDEDVSSNPFFQIGSQKRAGGESLRRANEIFVVDNKGNSAVLSNEDVAILTITLKSIPIQLDAKGNNKKFAMKWNALSADNKYDNTRASARNTKYYELQQRAVAKLRLKGSEKVSASNFVLVFERPMVIAADQTLRKVTPVYSEYFYSYAFWMVINLEPAKEMWMLKWNAALLVLKDVRDNFCSGKNPLDSIDKCVSYIEVMNKLKSIMKVDDFKKKYLTTKEDDMNFVGKTMVEPKDARPNEQLAMIHIVDWRYPTQCRDVRMKTMNREIADVITEFWLVPIMNTYGLDPLPDGTSLKFNDDNPKKKLLMPYFTATKNFSWFIASLKALASDRMQSSIGEIRQLEEFVSHGMSSFIKE